MADDVYNQNIAKLYSNPIRKPAKSRETDTATQITNQFFPSLYDTNPDAQKLKKKLHSRVTGYLR